MIGNKMYIYGGYDIREGPMQSFWSFDVNNVGMLSNSDLEKSHQIIRWQEIAAKGIKLPGKSLWPLYSSNWLTVALCFNRKNF